MINKSKKNKSFPRKPLTFKKYLNTYLFIYHFRARIDCVKHSCISLGRPRRDNFVKLRYS